MGNTATTEEQGNWPAPRASRSEGCSCPRGETPCGFSSPAVFFVLRKLSAVHSTRGGWLGSELGYRCARKGLLSVQTSLCRPVQTRDSGTTLHRRIACPKLRVWVASRRQQRHESRVDRGGPMSEQTLDVQNGFRILGRHRLVLAVFTAVGVGFGILLSILQAPTYVARARVVLPPSPGQDANGRLLRDIETEVHVVRSIEIIDAAAARANLREDSRILRRRVTVKARTADIIEVTAEGPSSRSAASLANAVADEYTAYANGASIAEADMMVRQLEKHAAELADQISDLERRIAATNVAGSGANSPNAASAVALLTAQLDAEARLYTTNTRIADIRLSAELSRGGTGVLEKATLPRGPARPRPAWNGAAGGLFGLVVGTVIVLRRAQHDVRLHQRADIAGAVQAPVLVSLPVPRRLRVKTYRAILEGWEASAVETLGLRHAFARLGVTSGDLPVNLAVATLGSDRFAPAVALKLAIFASKSGLRTAFVVANGHPSTAELRLACAGSLPSNPNLWISGVVPDPTDVGHLMSVDVTVTVVPFEPQNNLVVPTWGRHTVTVLAISSGLATAEALAATAMAYLDAGHRVQGILVANPDPNDRTSGALAVSAASPIGISTVEGDAPHPAAASSGGESSLSG